MAGGETGAAAHTAVVVSAAPKPTPRRKSAGIMQPGSVPGRRRRTPRSPSAGGARSAPRPAQHPAEPLAGELRASPACVVSSTRVRADRSGGHLRRARHRRGRGVHHVSGRHAVHVRRPGRRSPTRAAPRRSTPPSPAPWGPKPGRLLAEVLGQLPEDAPSAALRQIVQVVQRQRRHVPGQEEEPPAAVAVQLKNRVEQATCASTAPTIDRSSPDVTPCAVTGELGHDEGPEHNRLARHSTHYTRPVAATRPTEGPADARPGSAAASPPQAEPAPPARPVERFAARTAGMTASEIRALFAVASRPEVVSLAGGMPNLAALPLDVARRRGRATSWRPRGPGRAAVRLRRRASRSCASRSAR